MNTDAEYRKRVTRPFGIYVFCLWSLARALAIYPYRNSWLVLCAVAFIILCIPLLLGKSWGRSGYLFVSAVMVVWHVATHENLFAMSFPLYSLSAFGFAYWYFRQPKVLDYFGIEVHTPKWLKWLDFKVLGVSLDFLISFGLLISLIVHDLLNILAFYLLIWAMSGSR